jgi:hypothetical protein
MHGCLMAASSPTRGWTPLEPTHCCPPALLLDRLVTAPYRWMTDSLLRIGLHASAAAYAPASFTLTSLGPFYREIGEEERNKLRVSVGAAVLFQARLTWVIHHGWTVLNELCRLIGPPSRPLGKWPTWRERRDQLDWAKCSLLWCTKIFFSSVGRWT